jgi:hypothetical protein
MLAGKDVYALAVEEDTHIFDVIIKYYEAWLKAGSPREAVEAELGYMVPIAQKGEHVYPPGHAAAVTSPTIQSIITECDGDVIQKGIEQSRCTEQVVRV